VEKGERYREEGIDDREVVLTVRVVDARTIPSMILNVNVSLLP
jgi:hypothetical protein